VRAATPCRLAAVLLLGVLASACGSQRGRYHQALWALSFGRRMEGVVRLEDLARAGYSPAQFTLGLLYGLGYGVARDRLREAALLQAAAARGNVGARYTLARIYLRSRNGSRWRRPQQARTLLQGLAEEGYAPAAYRLAESFRRGEGGRPDDAQAVHWLRRAAEAGESRAIEELAEAYTQGELGLARDPAQGAQWRARLGRQF
jgi:TPR repeat protein